MSGVAEDVLDLRFSPAHTGGGIELWGPVHKLRDPAYEASQEQAPRP